MSGQFLAGISPGGLLSTLGVGILGAILAYVAKNWLTGRAERSDRQPGGTVGPPGEAARTAARRARETREAVDEEALAKLRNRPRGDNPADDLRDYFRPGGDRAARQHDGGDEPPAPKP